MKAKVVENETDGFLRLYYVGLITYQQNVVSGALCVKQRGKQHLQPAPASAGRRGGPCQPWSQERPREGRGPGRQARCSCRWLRGVRPSPESGAFRPPSSAHPGGSPLGRGRVSVLPTPWTRIACSSGRGWCSFASLMPGTEPDGLDAELPRGTVVPRRALPLGTLKDAGSFPQDRPELVFQPPRCFRSQGSRGWGSPFPSFACVA